MPEMIRRGLAHVQSRASDDGLVRYLGTAEVLDNHGTVILTDGIRLDRYLTNPVVMLDHGGFFTDSTDSVICRSEVVERVDQPIKGIEFGIRFVPDEVDEEAARAGRLAKAGFLNAASIGFTSPMISPPTDQEKDIFRLGPAHAIIRSCELIELSLVAIGSNPAAVKRALEREEITRSDAASLVPQIAIETVLAEVRAMKAEMIREFRELLGRRKVDDALEDATARIARVFRAGR